MYLQVIAALSRVSLSVAVPLVHKGSLEAQQMSQACQQPSAKFQGRRNACLLTGGQNSCCQPEETVVCNRTISTCMESNPVTDLQKAAGHSWHSLQQQGPHSQALQPAAVVAQTDPQACRGRTGLLHMPASTTKRSVLHANALSIIKSCD